MKVSFQGEKGAFSELAALKYFGENITVLPKRTFMDVFESLVNEESDYGILPVENSYAGSIYEVFDLLLKYDVKIVGEVILRIHHCLIAHPETKLNDIRVVYAHPQAILQCDEFLKKLNCKIEAAYDTAGSVKMLKEQNIKNAAAIAGKLAAEIYGMKILRENIESNPNNYTRFFILSRSLVKLSNGEKTTIVFSTENIPGALYRCLKPFAERNINLTKLESRPSKVKPWEYIFYLDFEGDINDPNISKVLYELKKYTTFLKVLGCYPKAKPLGP
ncbi:MAG: prephenate dehydratase [Candidatus Odinarchaeia archaeon]